MRAYIFILSIIVANIPSGVVFAQKVKKKDLGLDENLKTRVQKAKSASEKSRKKILKHDPKLKDSEYLQDSYFDSLLSDPDLTYKEFHEAMKKDMAFLSSCEKQDTDMQTRHWIKEYEKVIDKVWEDEAYKATDTKYNVQETSSEVGETSYDVIIKRDPDDEHKLWLHNFYNYGFTNSKNEPLRLPIIQEGKKLIIKSQTYQGFNVSGEGKLLENGTIELEYSVDDGSRIDKCKAYLRLSS